MRGRLTRTLFLLGVLAIALPPMTEGAQARPMTRNRIPKEGEIVVVVVEVPIDLFIAPNRRFRRRSDGRVYGPQGLANYWETGAENIWNEGLRNFRYRGCYVLQVDIQFDVITSGRGHSGHHRVVVRRSGYRSRVRRPNTPGLGIDGGDVFDASGTGNWGTLGPSAVAHKVGHFLGLGDDYTDVEDEDGNVVGAEADEGREGTLMANHRQGSRETWIDQELTDRLGG